MNNNKLRKVEVRKYDLTARQYVFDYIGVFHKFGVGFEEFENGTGNYSTAIIEKEDGTLVNTPVTAVKFLKE